MNTHKRMKYPSQNRNSKQSMYMIASTKKMEDRFAAQAPQSSTST